MHKQSRGVAAVLTTLGIVRRLDYARAFVYPEEDRDRKGRRLELLGLDIGGRWKEGEGIDEEDEDRRTQVLGGKTRTTREHFSSL